MVNIEQREARLPNTSEYFQQHSSLLLDTLNLYMTIHLRLTAISIVIPTASFLAKIHLTFYFITPFPNSSIKIDMLIFSVNRSTLFSDGQSHSINFIPSRVYTLLVNK